MKLAFYAAEQMNIVCGFFELDGYMIVKVDT